MTGLAEPVSLPFAHTTCSAAAALERLVAVRAGAATKTCRAKLKGLERRYGVEQMAGGEGMERAEKEQRQAGHVPPTKESLA